MNRLGFALAVFAVVAAATWAYHVNYRTKTAFGRVDELRIQIATEREAVEVLRVEWAYLNAPDRLDRLVELNNDLLKLAPMGSQGFDDVAAVPYPPRNTAPVDAMPEVDVEAILGLVEPVPLIDRQVSMSVPLPAPRPVGWRLE